MAADFARDLHASPVDFRFRACRRRFISHDWTDLGSPRVAELKANGTPILCWTVTTAQIEAEARRVADNITFEGYLPRIPD
jgi:hypothetical protein